MKIKLDNIIPDPNQPRKTFNLDTIAGLKDSLSGLGLIQPITVRPTEDGKYMVVVGERRYRAVKQVGVSEIECIIRNDVDDKLAREMQLTENSQQEDIPPLELGKAFLEHRKQYGLEGKELAKVIGLSEATINQYERLNLAAKSVQSYVKSGELDASTAYEISTIKDQDKQVEVADIVAEKGLARSAVRRIIPIVKDYPARPVESIVTQALYGIQIEKVNGKTILNEMKRQQVINIPPPKGKYNTIAIDPPWAIEKITREVRPNQYDMDYPSMTIDEIEALPIPDLANENGCHIYLWTTHKYLPTAFDILGAWGANYECLLTWVKNVGFTPFSWMYSTEHCLFARIGNLPLLKLGKRLDFQAKVREHSRKPEEFYNLVKEVSPEPRIDMFSREKREGFEQYGNEPSKFQS